MVLNGIFGEDFWVVDVRMGKGIINSRVNDWVDILNYGYDGVGLWLMFFDSY